MFIFDSTETSHLISGFFMLPHLLVGVAFAYYFRGFKLFMYLGIAFAIFGFAVCSLSIYYYYEDLSVLDNNEYLSVSGVAENVIVESRQTIFEINGLKFRCQNYSGWTKPKQSLCNNFSNGVPLKIDYVPNAERGNFPPLNRIIRITKRT